MTWSLQTIAEWLGRCFPARRAETRRSATKLESPRLMSIRLEERRVLAAPVITSAAAVSVAENLTDVQTVTATDADGDTVTFAITGNGEDDGQFEITPDGQLSFKNAPDFESPTDVGGVVGDNVYEVEVEANDGTGVGGVTLQTIQVTVTAVNDNSPVILSSPTASVAENETFVQTLDASDADLPAQTITYSITNNGADRDRFEINGAQLLFVDAPDFENPDDSDMDGVYEVEIQASDGAGNTTTQAIEVTVTNVDEAPVFTSSDTLAVNENSTAVVDLAAVDDATPSASITYTITSSGADRALFEIVNGNQLQFKAAPDFENAQDVGGDNTYEVEVLADDGTGQTTAQLIQVAVADLNEAPVFTSPNAVAVNENTTAVQTLAVTDQDLPAQSITYSITNNGADRALFEIVNGNQLRFKTAPDFENPTDVGGDNAYEVEVLADDGAGGTTTQLISVFIADLNEAPVFTSPNTVSVAENTTAVQTLEASDQDVPAQDITYSITGGADRLKFEIINGNELQFTNAPDFESPTDGDNDNVYEVEVEAEDPFGGSSTQLIQVTVEGVDDNDPGFTSPTTASADENTTLVQVLTATDNDLPAETLTYSITNNGADDALFEILNQNELHFRAAPDFENLPADANNDGEFEVEVEVSDGTGVTDTQTVIVTVVGVNDASPVFTSPTTGQVIEGDRDVLTITATDADLPGDDINFSISGGADAGRFTINNSNVLRFRANSVPDFESPADADMDNFYEVELTADDQQGGTTTQIVIVEVTPDNDADPVITSPSTASVAENTTVVQTLTATDADTPAQTVTFSIAPTGDGALFEIDMSNQLKFIAAPDFESPMDGDMDNDYLVEIVADDNMGRTSSQIVTVSVTGVNDVAPVFDSPQTASVAENSTLAQTLVASDGDLPAQTLSYSITGGVDQALFQINGDRLEFVSPPDYEAPSDDGGNNVYDVEVEVSDGAGLTARQTVSITVTPVNDEGPVFTSADNANVQENTLPVLELSATDADIPAQTITFAITNNGADDEFFEIVNGNELRFKEAPDFDTPADEDGNNIYEVEIEASDGEDGTTLQTVKVTLTGVNDNAPVFSSDATASVAENSTAVQTIVATDADLPTQTITYSITGKGADDAKFQIVNGNELVFGKAPDFEMPEGVGGNVYEVEIEANDNAGLTTKQTVLVTVTPVNEFAPVFTSTNFASVDENTLAVKSLTATDSDLPSQTITYSIAGGADASFFEIVNGNQVAFKAPPDFENPQDLGGVLVGDNVYSVQVRASDGEGMSTLQVLTVSVLGVNDNAPVFESADAVDVDENTSAVLTLAATDGDLPQQNVTFSLTGNGADAGAFQIVGGNQLEFVPPPDFENRLDAGEDNTYEVEVQASDNAGLVTTQLVRVTVLDVNDLAPTIDAGQVFSVDENAASGTIVGTVGFVDDIGGVYSWAIVSGNDNSQLMQPDAFSINSSGEIFVNNVDALDFETASTYALVLRVDDGSFVSSPQVVTIQLNDLVEAINYSATTGFVYVDADAGLLRLLDSADNNLIAPHVLDNVSTLTITGANGVDTTFSVEDGAVPIGGISLIGNANDTLIAPVGRVNDWTLTSPNAGNVNGAIQFQGIDQLQGAGTDQLNVGGGMFNAVRHQSTVAGSGEFDFDFDDVLNVGVVDVRYSGMSVVELNPTSIQHLLLDLPNGPTDAVIVESTQANMAELSIVQPAVYPVLAFLQPTETLSIRGGGGLDSVTFDTSAVAGDFQLGSNLRVESPATAGEIDFGVVGSGTLTVAGLIDLDVRNAEFASQTSANEVEIDAAIVTDAAGITAIIAQNGVRIRSQRNVGEMDNRLTIDAAALEVSTSDPGADTAPIFVDILTTGPTPLFVGSTLNSDIVVTSSQSLNAGTTIAGGAGSVALVASDALEISDVIVAGDVISLSAETLSVSSAELSVLQAISLGIITEGPIGDGDPLRTQVQVFAAETGDATVRVANQGAFELGTVEVLVDAGGATKTLVGILTPAGHATSVAPKINSTPEAGTSTPVSGGAAEIEFALSDPVADGYTVEIEWPTGGRDLDEIFQIPFPDPTPPPETLSAGNSPVVFAATYIANPDPLDPLAEVVVPFTVESPAGIELVDNLDPLNPVLLSRLSGSFTLIILSFGIPFQRIVPETPAPALSVPLPIPEAPPADSPPPTAPTPPLTFASMSSNQSAELVRKFVLRIVVEEENEADRYELDAMEFRAEVRLEKLFADLPNDHYRLYLVVGDSEQLIKDFVLEDGREQERDPALEFGSAGEVVVPLLEDPSENLPEASLDSQPIPSSPSSPSLPSPEAGAASEFRGSSDQSHVDEAGVLRPGRIPPTAGAGAGVSALAAHAAWTSAIDDVLARESERRLDRISRLLRRADRARQFTDGDA